MKAKAKLEHELSVVNKKVLKLVVFAFIVLESFIFLNARNQGQELAINWIAKNQAAVAQALFLENVHAISGLVERAVTTDQEVELNIKVNDINNSLILEKSIGENKNKLSHLLKNELFGFQFKSDLFFDESKVGSVVVSGIHNLSTVAKHTFFLLVFLTVFLFSSNRILKRYYEIMLESILSPILELRSHMNNESTLHSLPPAPPAGTVDEVRQLYDNFFALVKRNTENEKVGRELAQANAIAKVAKQVAHDIRSPLSALTMVANTLVDIPEPNRQLIRKATQRINDIANSLLAMGRNQNTVERIPSTQKSTTSTMLVAIIDEILSEKRIQFRNRDVQIAGDLRHGYGLFTNANGAELARALSNLVNNAVEATHEKGHVTAQLSSHNGEAIIQISDNGQGMSKDILARLGEVGFSYGKNENSQSGSGLGLHQVFAFVKNSNGKIDIQSQLGQGTCVTMTLPLTERPTWFVNKLHLHSGMSLVSIDDDETIHEIWSQRLSTLGISQSIPHHRLTSSEKLQDILKLTKRNQLCLVDFEFIGSDYNGIDIIQNYGLQNCAILVTSRYDDTSINNACEKLGIKILPKNLAHLVPIQLSHTLGAFLSRDEVRI